jgi:hypothetical protein
MEGSLKLCNCLVQNTFSIRKTRLISFVPNLLQHCFR